MVLVKCCVECRGFETGSEHHTHTRMHAHTHTHTHTHIHTHTHTHTHAHTLPPHTHTHAHTLPPSHTHRWKYTKNYQMVNYKKNSTKISQQVPTMATLTHPPHTARVPRSPCPLLLSPPAALLPFGPQAPSLLPADLPFLSGRLQQPLVLQALFLQPDEKENQMPLKSLPL